MMAAAKCPSCGHLFELRDGFGELLPLAYCSSCDSYYPEKLGECKWCGTKPEHPPITPLIWKAAGAAALVVMVGAAFVLRNRANDDVSPVIERARKEAAAPRIPSPATPNELSMDTALARSIASAAENTVPTASPVGGGSNGAVQSGEVAPASDAATVASQSTAMTMPGPAAATSFGGPPAATKSRRASRWVSSISRDWVIVRAGASRQSRIVASIGPNSRVQLGETQGTWRRIRAKGLVGWVEPRTSFSSRR
jgi:hypothetical protein